MSSIENLEFLNLNTVRNYPIKEGVSRMSVEGVTLPNDVLVDCVICTAATVSTRFYISKIINLTDHMSVDISDDSDVLVGNFVVPADTHTLYDSYPLLPGSSYAGANGRVTIGSLDNLRSLYFGTLTFTLATAELESRVSIPALTGVSRVTFVNADGTTFSVTGDVVFNARTNLRFVLDSGTVRIDAGDGLGLNSSCAPEDLPIKTINGVSPDAGGNFTLDTDDHGCAAFTVLPSNDGLLLNDTCCRPCVGCDEIGTLTDRLITLESDLLKIRDYYSELLQAFTAFKTSVSLTCAC